MAACPAPFGALLTSMAITAQQARADETLSFGRARQQAAKELAAREAVVFPHYSLLEGYDRFGRLPKPSAARPAMPPARPASFALRATLPRLISATFTSSMTLLSARQRHGNACCHESRSHQSHSG